VKWIAVLMQKIVPIKKGEMNNTHEKKLHYLDSKTMMTPTLAAVNAHLEVCGMGKIANENLSLALESFFERNADKINLALENEKTIDFLNHEMAALLIKINNMTLSNHDAERVGEMFRVISDIERIGDHAENIAEYALAIKDSDLKFSDAAIIELKTLSDMVIEMTAKAIEIYEKEDASQLPQIDLYEKNVDVLSIEYTENHIERLKIESCEPKSGVIFTDIIGDLERIADHANNIAYSILSENERNIVRIEQDRSHQRKF
jgi:phosphate:Na+ symporter